MIDAHPPLPVVLPPSAWSYPTSPAGRRGRGATPRRRSCSTSSPATTAGSTTCARVLDVIFDATTGSRCRRRFGRAIMLRTRPSRRPSGRGGRQSARGDGGLHRRRRRRQGRALHHGGRLVPPADRVPRRQPRHDARQPLGASGVLRSGARMFAAQTAATTLKLHVTLRKAYGFGLHGDVPARVRRPGDDVRLPRRDDGAMSAAALSRATHAKTTSARSCVTPNWRRSYRSAEDLGSTN